MKRTISNVAVLGSGVMGSRIACHFANVGVHVLLLDIPGKEDRNSVVNGALQQTLKSAPAALYRKSFASRIVTGNYEDNLPAIANADWIVEVVIENPEIKQKLYAEAEKYRKPGSLITSNTSGIPIHLLGKGRSEDFRKHFCGTHFFNPPRYLRLLEVIPTGDTDPEVTEFLMDYGRLFLGKTTVLCKDTPAFIANRIGVYSILSLFHLVGELGLGVDDADTLTGPVLGRPKSATFRTCDIVGLDTLVKVARALHETLHEDESRDRFRLPEYIEKMVAEGMLGDKSGGGFYKKVKNKEGKTEILSLDLQTLEYRPKVKNKFATLAKTRGMDSLEQRLPVLVSGDDAAGEFYRRSFYGLFRYATLRIPEISDDLYRVDEALRAGFGWEKGVFECWDILGVAETAKRMTEAGQSPAPWVGEMLAAGKASFYRREHGRLLYYDIASRDYKPVPGTGSFIFLDSYREKTVWKNAGCSVLDIGDGVLNLEFHTKMNTMGGEIVQGIHKAIDIAEKDFRGVVIANEGANFSAGANLAMIFMLATDREFDEIDMAVRAFQEMNMRVRYSSVPVVVAPHALALGGGCEMTLHADKVVAHAETYIGLVEFGVGLVPGGGGSKEMTLRASDAFAEGIIDEHVLRRYFLTIAQAKVSTSAYDAFELDILKKGRDEVIMNLDLRIAEAKKAVLALAEEGYTAPARRNDIRVLGRSGLGMIFAGVNAMVSGHYVSPHDALLSQKLGYIMCGGDLSASSLVSEDYLLGLEREAFLSLCGERKTLERIQSFLATGKPLRN